MVKLSGKDTHAAWEDFQQYLLDVGLLREVDINTNRQAYFQEKGRQDLAQMAFKQGFVSGALNAVSKEAVTYQPEIVVKTGITRNVESRNNRTEEQMKEDNRLVEEILQHHIDPMPLADIIKLMRLQHGRGHWNNNNGSGFMKMAIKYGHNVKRFERGIYGYDWEGQK